MKLDQILDLLKKVVNPPVPTTATQEIANTHVLQQSNPPVPTTIQEIANTHVLQQSTDYSTLEELLNTTTDEELDFLDSPSWNSPHFSGINTSNVQLPTTSSFQSPPVNSIAQTFCNVNPTVQTPHVDLMYRPPPGTNPAAQIWQSQTRSGVNPLTQSYPQPSFSNSVSSPKHNESVPASLLPPPFSTPPKLLPVDDVMRDYPGNDEFTLRRLTTALARDAIFGKQALSRSSLSGKKNTGCLEKRKLEYIKALVRSRVPTMSDVTFEAIWGKCHSSLSKSCQTLRVTAKKKLLT